MGSAILWNDGWASNAALKACMKLMDYEAAVLVISIVIKSGFRNDRFCGSSMPIDPFQSTKLVGLFADLGLLEHAYKMSEPKLSFYKAMKRKNDSDVLNLLQMGSDILWNDGWASNVVLKACMKLMDYEAAVQVISILIKTGFRNDRFCGSSMVCFLVKFGNVDRARWVSDGIYGKDVVCWNSMIGDFVHVCKIQEAFNLFFEM
ncbi:Pentatricopeptide repeat [Dillenia turbinata]|uniref:Pentatricopeptide repeat n=1 Tax=Dillenia turbinata TaxID=194707 RepID=A0AAN8W5L3_9MAGN